MRSNFPFIVSVILPFGAGPGQQRLFLGPVSGMPPALVTYLRNNAWDPIGGFIGYGQSIAGGGVDDNYTFLVQAVAFPGEQPSGWVLGSFTTGFFETQLITDGGIVFVSPFGENIQLSIGSGAGPGQITVPGTSTVTIGDGTHFAQLFVEALSALQVLGQLNIRSGGDIEILSGGLMTVDSGGILRIAGASPSFQILSGGSGQILSGGILVNDGLFWNQPGGLTQFDEGSLYTFKDSGASKAAPRGYVFYQNDQSTVTVNNGAGFGNLIFDNNTDRYSDGLAFEAVVAGHWRASVAGTTVQLELTNGSGGVVAATKQLVFPQVAGVGFYAEVPFRFVRTLGSGPQATGIIIRGSAAGGNVTLSPPSAQCPRELWARCIGAAGDFPNLPSI